MNYGTVLNITITSCGFLFFLFLLIVYFHKRVNYSVKNLLFKRMMIMGILTFISHFSFFVFTYLVPNSFYQELSSKGICLSLLISLILWIYYVLILIFEKNSDVSSFIRQNHGMIDYVLLAGIVLITVIEAVIPITVKAGTISLFSAGVLFPYIVAVLLCILPFPCILSEKCLFHKRLLSFYVINILLLLTAIVFWFYPNILLGGFLITLCYYLIYSRLENPDIVYIRSYYKEHERMRSIREKYGFLFNMSPELRDLLNEISFMKDNYLIDEKKRISKRKLETLISDFVKSSEIGETRQTTIDDDGIEILEMEEDIPEEMLVTKEIYSLKELQEILKEDNLPKW